MTKNKKSTRDIYRKKKPWLETYSRAKSRCENKNNKSYKNYGGRGIRFLLTSQDLEYLWFRDKAKDMKCPSIDRVDNDGDYRIDNCRYIELSENSKKRSNCFRKNCKNGHPMSGINLSVFITKEGYGIRKCKICHKLKAREFRRKLAAMTASRRKK